MTKRQVLKDFSELRPVETRIEALAANIYQIVWRGEAIDRYKPRVETQIFRVWKMAKLDLRQQSAWQAFRDDFDRAAGWSGGTTSSYGEYMSESPFGPSDRAPVAYTNRSFDRIKDIFERHLGRRDKALLYDLLRDDLQRGGDLNLETIGIVRTGYKDKVTSRVAGVVLIQSLLDKVADYYGL